MPIEDAEMTRMVRREIGRRYVDSSYLDVRVMHGVVFLRGWLEKLRGHTDDIDLNEEVEIIQRILLQKPGIREVVVEMDWSRGRPGQRTA